MQTWSQRWRRKSLVMLKNVGAICPGCSGGHHEDCAEVNEHRDGKHMCVCYWSVGPEYHARLRREKVITAPVPCIGVGVVAGIGTTVHTASDKASRLLAGLREAA